MQEAAVSEQIKLNSIHSAVKSAWLYWHDMVLQGALSSTGAVKDMPELRSKHDSNHAALKWKMQTSYHTIFLIVLIQHWKFINRHPDYSLEGRKV